MISVDVSSKDSLALNGCVSTVSAFFLSVVANKDVNWRCAGMLMFAILIR